ncbi:hypothetical protein E2C01_065280 [Portunus trituberculatus]|uniref:Uncharacterized protein n=1 Tax=Portunus trituberculatus TaxID=210409 RepID=A0A5B7HLG8_PORTR|nr:hypothetical protein [Portunus trituberculatus]
MLWVIRWALRYTVVVTPGGRTCWCTYGVPGCGGGSGGDTGDVELVEVVVMYNWSDADIGELEMRNAGGLQGRLLKGCSGESCRAGGRTGGGGAAAVEVKSEACKGEGARKGAREGSRAGRRADR